MKVNNLSGQDFFDARAFVGISITSAAKNTGVNRNTLSNFEREKATLSVHEKRKLVSFYQDRGYDFSMPEPADTEELHQHHSDALEQVKDLAESELPQVVSEALLGLADSVNDLVTVSLSESAEIDVTETPSGLMFVDPVEATQEAHSLHENYLSLEDRLLEHFKADQAGETKGKVSFFGDSASGRGEKLVCLLALQYLRTLKAQNPSMVSLSFSGAEEDTDNARMLKVMHTCFEYQSLGEFGDIQGEILN